MPLPTTARSRSFGTTTMVSTCFFSSAIPISACRLRVRIHRDELHRGQAFVDHAVERVAAATAHADDFHPRVLRYGLFELEDHGSLGSPIRRSPAAIASVVRTACPSRRPARAHSHPSLHRPRS